VETLLPGAKRSAVIVSYRLQPDPEGAGDLRWILAPVSAWAHGDEPLQQQSPALLPHPIGTPENRWSRRRRDRLRREAAVRDRVTFLARCEPTRGRKDLQGSFCARPAAPARIRLEAL
jgi:hypothetical protein